MIVQKENRLFAFPNKNGGNVAFTVYANVDGVQKTLIVFKDYAPDGTPRYSGLVKNTEIYQDSQQNGLG